MADGTGDEGTGAASDAGKGDAMRDAADQARDSFNRAQGSFSDHVIEPARRAGEAMRASGQQIADGSATIGLKIIEQAEQNSHQAFQAMRDAAQAKDVSEVVRIQGEYLREQGQRSLSQAREIGELIAQFGRAAIAPLRPGSTSD